MDEMINQRLIKILRRERYWSQEQLASISGLSLRTIQRIENQGKCSLESKKALAAAFEMDTANLESQTEPAAKSKHFFGCQMGFFGATAGMALAYLGITVSLLNQHITYGEAGLYYGSTAVLCGLSCAIIGITSHKLNL